MENRNILVEIQLAENQFTKAEKKIADYVLSNKERVPFMSITELADACGVAEASVNRFCRALKVRGYQEFKMLLSIAQAAPREPVQDNDSLLEQILQYHIAAIRETADLLDPETVKRTADMMSTAERIVFVGVGNSMITAQEAYGMFLHITPKVEYIIDPHMQSMMASMAGPGDMLVFISYSGATKDNVHVAQLAKERGARICVITRYPKSELTKFADTVLICGSEEGPLEGGSMGGKMSQLHIIDVLFQYYYQKNPEESAKNNRLTAGANVEKFY